MSIIPTMPKFTFTVHPEEKTMRFIALFVIVFLGQPVIAYAGQPNDGQKLERKAPRLDHYGDPLPARALFRLGTTRLQHEDWLNDAVFSPNGKILAAASVGEKQIVLWEMPSGSLLKRLPVPGRFSSRLLFSPDGRWLASVCGDFGNAPSFLQVWEVESGKVVVDAVQANTFWFAFAFAPDSKLIAAVDKKDIRLWELPSAKKRPRLQAPAGKVLALTCFDAKKILALVENNNTVSNWDAATGKELYSFPGAEKASKLMGGKGVFTAAFSSDGKLFAYAGSDSNVTVRDVAKGQQLHRFQGHLDAIAQVSFSADSQSLLSCSWHDRPRVWDLVKGKEKTVLESADGVTFGAFSPDGKLLTMGGGNGDYGVRLWDAVTGKKRFLGPGHQGVIRSVSFSPDGKQVITATASGGDGVIRLWDAGTGRQIREFAGHRGGIMSVCFSPDSKMLASAGWLSDGCVRLWDAQTGDAGRKIDGAGGGKGDVFFFPDGRSLVAADLSTNAAGTCDVKAWEVKSGKETLHISRPQNSAGCIALSPDGQTLAAGYGDQVKMFDPISGKERRWSTELSKPMGRPDRLAFGPKSRTLAVLRYNQSASIYELVSQRELCQLPKSVSIAFSPKGRFVAHSGWKDGIRIHDMATGKTCLTLEGHPGQTEGYAAALAFSPDGTRLISGGRDGVAIIWEVSDLAQIAPLRPDREVNAKTLDEWWFELDRPDPKAAHRALWNLVAAGESSIPLLKAKLKANAAPNAKQLAQFIADLDSTNFEIRTRASKELENLGDAAEETLRRALEKKPSIETVRRIDQLLAKIAEAGVPAESLRVTRALSVLEQIPGPQARALLESLAKGPPEARLTHDAQRVLQRLPKSAVGPK